MKFAQCLSFLKYPKTRGNWPRKAQASGSIPLAGSSKIKALRRISLEGLFSFPGILRSVPNFRREKTRKRYVHNTDEKIPAEIASTGIFYNRAGYSRSWLADRGHPTQAYQLSPRT